MKWLLVAAAFVLGGAMTWLLTVKRVTRTLHETGVEQAKGAGVPASQNDTEDGVGAVDREGHADLPDEASAFGGERTEASDDPGPAERWHRDAEDVDALLSRSGANGGDEEGSAEGATADEDQPG